MHVAPVARVHAVLGHAPGGDILLRQAQLFQRQRAGTRVRIGAQGHIPVSYTHLIRIRNAQHHFRAACFQCAV